MAEKDTFKGKNIIITGGSSGIGRSAARTFARMGANVTIVARREIELRQAVNEIQSNAISPDQLMDYSVLDVTDAKKVTQWADKYQADHGPPDVIINSAGIADVGYFEETSFEVFQEQISVNLYGVINICKCFIPMMKSSGGHIVNISSMAGVHGIFGYTAYSTSKFAVIGFSQSLRSEMKRFNIHVSVLCPPSVDTPMMAVLDKAPKETKAVEASGGLLSPSVVVQVMIKGMLSKKFMIVPGATAKILHVLDRFAPMFIEWYLDRIVRKA